MKDNKNKELHQGGGTDDVVVELVVEVGGGAVEEGADVVEARESFRLNL